MLINLMENRNIPQIMRQQQPGLEIIDISGGT